MKLVSIRTFLLHQIQLKLHSIQFNWSSGLPGSTLPFQHPSAFHLKQTTFKTNLCNLQDLSFTISIYQYLPRAISNNQYLPLFSDLQHLPRVIINSIMEVNECHWRMVNVADGPRRMPEDLVSRWKDFEAAEWSEGCWPLLIAPGRCS